MDVLIDQLGTAGGPILLALLVLSMAATAVSVFKILQFARLGVGRQAATRGAVAAWLGGDTARALQMARSETAPAAGVAANAMLFLVQHPGQRDRARELAIHGASDVILRMTSHLRMLEAAVQAAPMIGLLGTVIGMISAFGELSAAGGAIDPTALATGIWTALITTAAGLGVAIPFYFILTWLESRVERERAAMESAIGAIVNSDLMRGRGPADPAPARGTAQESGGAVGSLPAGAGHVA